MILIAIDRRRICFITDWMPSAWGSRECCRELNRQENLPRRAARVSSQRLEPLRHVDAGVLDIAYYEAGPADGPAVMLLHGFPYDIHSYVDVAPMLAAQGCRVIVPYLRGYGPTRFRDPRRRAPASRPRSAPI